MTPFRKTQVVYLDPVCLSFPQIKVTSKPKTSELITTISPTTCSMLLFFSVQHKQPTEIVLEKKNLSVSRAPGDCLCYLHGAHNLPELSCCKLKDAPATPSEPKKEQEKTPVMIPKYHASKTTDTVRINLKNHLFVVEEGSEV